MESFYAKTARFVPSTLRGEGERSSDEGVYRYFHKKNFCLTKVLGMPYNIIKVNMTSDKNSLSSGLEDYIEAIYIAKTNKVPLKGAELARKLNISRASVSEALSKLVSLGLIEYKRYGSINLTQKGEKEAKKVYGKHGLLKDFFEIVLQVSEKEAGENACKIEHIISENVLNRISALTDFFKDNPEILNSTKKY